MTDFDDDTQFWDDPGWNRTGELPAIHTQDTDSSTRTSWLGRLARDETGAEGVRASRARRSHTGRGHRFERTRTHHVVTSSSRQDVDEAAAPPAGFDDGSPVDHWVEPQANRSTVGVDPRLLRVGAIVGAAVLVIPIGLALRDDADSATLAGATATTVAPGTLAPPTSTTIVLPATVAPTPVAPPPVTDGDDDDDAVAVAGFAKAEPDEPECAGTYTVIPNDSWNRFPRTSGASVEEWLAANDATLDTPLYVGDELCIPEGATAPAPPQTTAPPTTAAPETTAAPTVTAAPTTQPPATTAAPVATAQASAPPPPPPPATTTPPAPVPAGAPSTESLCGAMPTSNGNPPGTPGPAEVEAMIREIWPDDIEARALCIAKNEAKLRSDLSNYCCYGVFALYFKYVPEDLKQQYGVDEPTDLYDARTNIAIAYQIYLRSGWSPWSQTDPG